MSNQKWLIYGANGYSAQLILAEAIQRGLKPVIAGRTKEKLEPLAEQYGLEYRVFGLSQPGEVIQHLEDIDLVLHCAGPFSQTSAVMLEACLHAKAHYLDITGEIDVFEYAHSTEMSRRAEKAGIVVCPGVGFDVVPTDCLAATLKHKMADANQLSLAFSGGNALSPGTAKTSVEAFGRRPRVRQDGQIISDKIRIKSIGFGREGSGARQCMNISWGDVSTAFYTTGIENIDVYIPVSPATLKKVRRAIWFGPLLQLGWVQSKLKKAIGEKIAGPDAQRRAAQRTVVWGQCRNPKGETLTARIEIPNGYDLTVTAALGIVEKLIAGEPVQAGSFTPSQLMGKDYIFQLPGCTPVEFV